MVARVSRDEEALEQAKAHLRSLSLSLPELIEHLRQLAMAHGEVAVASSLPDSKNASERLLGLLAYVEQYTRVDARTFGPVDIRAVLEGAVALTRAEIERSGRFGVSYLEAPLVRGNPRQLGHVFVALLINAAQSLPDGAPDANYVAAELDTNDEGWARIAIADSGSGIAAEDVAHIFEPLYSTKRGAGMGVGLAAVREIITGLGGRISVETVPGSGTLFIIELPPAS
jgi:signal transduction histidine kinase